MVYICYVQPLYFVLTTIAYFIFICFDKLEETQQLPQKVAREKYRSVRRLINFLVTFPLFSWFGVLGFIQKELLPCLPLADVKNTKKYTCMCESSNVFKYMIS